MLLLPGVSPPHPHPPYLAWHFLVKWSRISPGLGLAQTRTEFIEERQQMVRWGLRSPAERAAAGAQHEGVRALAPGRASTRGPWVPKNKKHCV